MQGNPKTWDASCCDKELLASHKGGDVVCRRWFIHLGSIRQLLRISCHMLIVSLPLSKYRAGNKFVQSYTPGIYWPDKKEKQCIVIRDFDKLLTFLVTATTVGIHYKHKPIISHFTSKVCRITFSCQTCLVPWIKHIHSRYFLLGVKWFYNHVKIVKKGRELNISSTTHKNWYFLFLNNYFTIKWFWISDWCINWTRFNLVKK